MARLNRSVGGIDYDGQGFTTVTGRMALAIGSVGDGIEIEIALQLANAFRNPEEEERFATGPPMVAPNGALQGGLDEDSRAEQEAGAFRSVLRRNHRRAVNWLVPDFMTALMPAPPQPVFRE